MDLHFSYLLESLCDSHELNEAQVDQFVRCCGVLGQLEQEEVEALLEAAQRHVALHDPPQETLLDPLLARLTARGPGVEPPQVTDALRAQIVALYGQLPAARCAWRLLQWLTTSAQEPDLRAFVACVVRHPPEDPQAAALAMTPLFQSRQYRAESVFPRLFAALEHLSIAAPVLDLANYLCRSGMVPSHPAADRGAELAHLLGSLAQQLGCIEENPGATGRSPAELSQKVDQCVSLVVSLCDALALIGDSTCVGKLYQAMELHHRRIRTEAAAALAKFGESAGVEELKQLAGEPVARLRVLSHAEELGVLDQIDEHYRTEEAEAESRVALELAQPAYFGIPPSALELVDTRTQFWPSYDDPMRCYLFRYEYRFADTSYSNIAIAGPLVHAFAADLNDLPPDDIYAAYAGWHVEDESVFEIPLDTPTMEQRAEAERLARRLREEGYDEVQPLMLGYFFGDRSLVARAQRENVWGVAVVDQQGVDWFPVRTRRHAIGAHEAFCIYKGRRLLRSFND